MNKATNFLIVGLGLMGGSYAYALSKRGYHVSAIEINQLSIDFAIENGIIEQGSTFDIDLIQQADVILFGLYPKAMIEWITTYQSYFKSGSLISDVSGVKTNVIDKVQAILRDDVEFIGSHPMAGKEVSGVKYANDEMFQQANFIITPTEKNSTQAIEFLKQFASELDFANISILTPAQHDEMIGYVSQLTHAIAISLMNANDHPELVNYTGDSFRDLTRIAKINENMWTELFFLNKQNLIKEIDDFEAALETLKQTLIDENAEKLKELMIQSTIRRQYFDKNNKRK